MEKPSLGCMLTEEYNDAVDKWHTSTTRALLVKTLFVGSNFVLPAFFLSKLDTNGSVYAQHIYDLLWAFFVRVAALTVFDQVTLEKTVNELVANNSTDHSTAFLRLRINVLLSGKISFAPAAIAVSVGASDFMVYKTLRDLPHQELLNKAFTLDAFLSLAMLFIILAQQKSARNIARQILDLSTPASSSVRVDAAGQIQNTQESPSPVKRSKPGKKGGRK